jgi:hypothetical protein
VSARQVLRSARWLTYADYLSFCRTLDDIRCLPVR